MLARFLLGVGARITSWGCINEGSAESKPHPARGESPLTGHGREEARMFISGVLGCAEGKNCAVSAEEPYWEDLMGRTGFQGPRPRGKWRRKLMKIHWSKLGAFRTVGTMPS